MSKNPFNGGGPTIQSYLDKGVEMWNRPSLQKVLEASSEVLDCYSEIQNPSLWSMAKLSSKTLTKGLDLYQHFFPVTTKTEGEAKDRFNKILESEGFEEIISARLAKVFLPYLNQLQIRSVVKDDGEDSKNTLYAYDLPSGPIYWVDNNVACTEIIASGKLEVKDVQREITQALWDTFNNHVELSFDKGTRLYDFRGKTPPKWRYEGDQGDQLLARWKSFYERGVRRSIILHGPPGTGKSTLARQVAEEIDGKILYVPVQTMQELNDLSFFLQMIDMLGPDVLIVDDIDRLRDYMLGTFLAMFEETENNVPIMIVTTNHLKKLPDAMKRPGRFDEIWKIAPPSDDVRLRVIRYLAEIESVELTEEQAQQISSYAEEQDLPGAHLREILRRISVLGWEAGISVTEEDLTFSEEWVVREEDQKDDRGLLREMDYDEDGWEFADEPGDIIDEDDEFYHVIDEDGGIVLIPKDSVTPA